MFCVCEVIDEAGKSVEVIPESWLHGQPDKDKRVKCFWPPVKNPTKFVSQRKKPEPDRNSYAARVLRKYECYQKARQALPRAEDTSDWSEPDATPKRKRVSFARRKDNNVGQESSGDELSQPKGALKRLPQAPTFICVQENYHEDLVSQNVVVEAGSSEMFSIKEVKEELREGVNQESDDYDSNSIHLDSESQSDSETTPESQQVRPPFIVESTVGTTDEGNAAVLELLKRLVLDTGVIKRTLQNIEGRLEKLENCMESGVKTAGQISTDTCPLPHSFSTVADFQEFDNLLDDNKKEMLKREFLRCGGDTVVEFVGRVMKKLMTNEVGLDYSLWGFRNNINFSKTSVWKIVKESALSLKRISPTEKAIEKAVSEWFRHSGDRIKQQNNKLASKSSRSTYE